MLKKGLFLIFIFSLILGACEKNITVKLPDSSAKLVVEGYIEPGLPPFITLTKSAAYFDKTDLAAFQNSFVHGANIEISEGGNSYTLNEFCSSDFSDQELMLLADAVGIPFEVLRSVNYCVYTSFPPVITGVPGKTYGLRIVSDGKTYTSETQIPVLVPLDSVWFKVEKDQVARGLGFTWAHLTDPDTLGNAYNWQVKRLGKDPDFATPRGGSSDDRFYNGSSFDFAYDRPFSARDRENGDSSGYFRIGDTIVVKSSTIDHGHYLFRKSYEDFLSSQGNPFASPSSIKTNIVGGALGFWGGFGVTYDTIYAK